ncbi:hypothetical protein [Pontiella sp.]|uniref:hypothetical protein n=1 Tax=Pontiella sp. TaxID=2837462 RepID=UPI00356329DB
MMKLISKFIFSVCVLGLITGCVSKQSETSSTKEIEIHFNGSFEGQQVECVVENKTLFKKKLIRSKTLGLAHREKTLVPEDRYNLKIIIDGYTYSYDLKTDSGKYVMFHLQEGVAEVDAFMLSQTDEQPLYR